MNENEFVIEVVETIEVYKKLIVEKDEDVDGKNLGYLDGEDLNTDVEGYNAKLVRVLHQESDVIDRRIV
tara:strand:- start:8927 stop:9133 length:207 start_codon:yes stop_codon:yes gene_type:complete